MEDIDLSPDVQVIVRKYNIVYRRRFAGWETLGETFKMNQIWSLIIIASLSTVKLKKISYFYRFSIIFNQLRQLHQSPLTTGSVDPTITIKITPTPGWHLTKITTTVPGCRSCLRLMLNQPRCHPLDQWTRGHHQQMTSSHKTYYWKIISSNKFLLKNINNS